VQILQTQLKWLVLQHPQENDHLLGTLPLLTQSMPQEIKVCVGLSWPSFKHLLGQEVNPKEWFVCFITAEDKQQLSLLDTQFSNVCFFDKQYQPVESHHVKGIILLDGTWSQAKTLWWRNPWLLKLGRVRINTQQPSIYGKLRKEPQKYCLSTLETVAAIIETCEPHNHAPKQLKTLMRTMVQRIRDNHEKP